MMRSLLSLSVTLSWGDFMDKLIILSKLGGLSAARQVYSSLIHNSCSCTVFLDDGFSFHSSDLHEAIQSPLFDYWDGVVLGVFGGTSRLILSVKHGYIGCYWGYQSFRPTIKLKTVSDLDSLKSEALNDGVKIDWETYQWVLNNFNLLLELSEAKI